MDNYFGRSGICWFGVPEWGTNFGERAIVAGVLAGVGSGVLIPQHDLATGIRW